MNFLSFLYQKLFPAKQYPELSSRRTAYLRQVSMRVEMMCSYAASLGFSLSYNPMQWPLRDLVDILHSSEIYPTQSQPADYVIKDANWREFAGPYAGDPTKALEIFRGATVDLYTPDMFRAPSVVSDVDLENLKVYGITNDPEFPFYPVSKVQREALVISIYNLQVVGGASRVRVFVPTVPYSFEMLIAVCERVDAMSEFFDLIDWERVEVVLQSSVWREVVTCEVEN